MVKMSKINTKQVDPAVEEVLASIRKIMAIDLNEADTSAEKAPDIIAFPGQKNAPIVKKSADGSDILTLTEMIDQDGSIVSLNQREETMVAQTEKDQANNNKKEESATEELALEESAPAEESPAEEEIDLTPENIEKPILAPEDIESLMSPEAVEKSTMAFEDLNKLTGTMQEKIANQSFGNQTIDQLMREMLKPLLKEWLDSHLPSLVKWLVAEKIEQMIREKQDSTKK